MTKREYLHHHPIGPSGWLIAKECPGSTNLAAEAEECLPPLPDEPAAVEGTSNHELIASALHVYLDSGAIDDDASQIVLNAIEFVQWVIDAKVYNGWELFDSAVESRVTFEKNCPEALVGVFGTPDLVLYFQQGGAILAVVIDGKTGWRGPTDAEISHQLAGYCALVKTQISWCGNDTEPQVVTDVEGWMARYTSRDDHRVLENPNVTLTMAAWEQTILRNMAEGERRTKAGPHCRYCPVLGFCESTVKMLGKVKSTGRILPQKTVAALTKEYEEHFRQPGMVEDVVTMLKDLPIYEAAVNALKARAKEMELQEPGMTGGHYWCDETEGARQVRSVPAAWNKMKALGVPTAKIAEKAKLTATDLEDLYMSEVADEDTSKKDAKRDFNLAMEGIIYRDPMNKLQRM